MANDVELNDFPDEAMILVYKSKPPHQRLEIAFALWTFARSLTKSGLKMRHPDWPEKRIEEETANRMLHAPE